MNQNQQRAWLAIEILLFWEGQITRKRLAKLLVLSDTRAYQLIKQYEDNHSDFIYYDRNKKIHFPTEQFIPQLTKNATDEYLQLLLQKNKNGDVTEFILAPQRYIIPEVLKVLCKAIQRNEKIKIIYQSLQNPDTDQWRIITPHKLIFSGLRWHVRAFCENSQTFKDFVLSRFFQAETAGFGQVSAEQDLHWNAFEKLVIMADPRLNEGQKKLIEREYGMHEGRLVIETRGALIRYQMELLNIDTSNPNPESQQIIVETTCWKRIQCYFSFAPQPG